MKKLNKIIAISLVVFLFFSFKTIKNIFSKINLASIKKKEYVNHFELKDRFFLSLTNPSLLEKVRDRNIFISTLEEKAQKDQSESLKIEPSPAPLGINEFRDEKTGLIFKFLGTIKKEGEYQAIFWKINELNLNQDEKKSVIISKRSKLSENIRIYEIGEKWVKLKIGGESTELKIFQYLPEIIEKNL